MLISEIDGTRILFEDGPRVIVDGDGPAAFLAGWRPVLAYSGLAPITIVPFQHDDGAVGVWFLDGNMRRCGGALPEIPAQLLADMVLALCPLLDGIWQELVLQRRPGVLTEAQLAFFFLPEHCRLLLLELYLSTFDQRPAYRGFAFAARGPFGASVLDCGTRRVPLIGGELHWLSDPELLQRLFDRLLVEKSLAFRSPCDGSPVNCRKSILLDTDLIAYKLHDEHWDLSVFLIAGNILNRTKALFFPEANLVLTHDPSGFASACPDLVGTFLIHIVRHGMALFGYLANEQAEPVHVWRGRIAIHPGHVLLNDYGGIDRMLEAAGGDVPQVLVCETGSGSELYGPLDEVFPALKGRVRRESAPLMGLVSSLYAGNALVFCTSGVFVSRHLRQRILHPLPVVGADAPVLLLGLRTENRTATNLAGFCSALVAQLAAGPGPVTLVVDGHNQDDDGILRRHGQPGVAESPVAVEQALVDTIRSAAAGTQVSVISTIGAPTRDSLGWARAARGFVAFWGAGLVKYRWVCNTPGLVITSRWNLENLHDLQIYSSPACMDDPSPLAFVSVDAVQDRPYAPVMIRHGDELLPSLCNFELDIPLVLRDVDHVLGALLFPPMPAEPAPAIAKPVRGKRKVGVQAG